VKWSDYEVSWRGFEVQKKWSISKNRSCKVIREVKSSEVKGLWSAEEIEYFQEQRLQSDKWSKRVKQSHYRPGQAQRVRERRGCHISRQSAHEGGKVVSSLTSFIFHLILKMSRFRCLTLYFTWTTSCSWYKKNYITEVCINMTYIISLNGFFF